MSDLLKTHIWVDADACPKPIREIIFRAAIRTGIHTTFVANHALQTPSSPLIHFHQVSSGFDVADNYIVEKMNPGDLVITSDIPMAADVIAHQGNVINTRGEIYTQQNIKQRLAMRNLMESLRSTGEITGGPSALGAKDKQQFANALDQHLGKIK